jgi:hypothetical protein
MISADERHVVWDMPAHIGQRAYQQPMVYDCFAARNNWYKY